jgi:starch synthase
VDGAAQKSRNGERRLEEFAKKKGIENLNFMRRGIVWADMVNTVSEHYAQEVIQPRLGQDLDRLLLARMKEKTFFGIVNGIDYLAYNPMTDPGLVSQYGVENLENKVRNKLSLQKEYRLKVGADIPLLGMVTRITEQKGFDLLMEIIEPLLRLNLELILVGDGDKRYKNFFAKLADKYPRKLAAHMHFKRENVTRIYAATDMFLMPSRFEPCGLGQLISLRYGSVPIVHSTGGLSDTIQNYNPRSGKGNGFTFSSYDSLLFLMAIVRALETYRYPEVWRRIAQNGMRASYSWSVPAKKYRLLYGKTLRIKK